MGAGWDLHTHSFLLDDEIRAAFEICRKRGFKVMAHATNPDALKNAIRLGAHSIEHGYIMDDECIALLLEHGTWYVPTLAINHSSHDGRVGARASTLHCSVTRLQHVHRDPWRPDAHGRRLNY